MGRMIKTFTVLNVDHKLSTMDPSQIALQDQESVSVDSYIVSEVDEELLILIEFTKLINLYSFKIYALAQENDDIADASPPKNVAVYKTQHLNINFDDIKSLKADKSITCTPTKLVKGQKISLKKKAFTFSKIKYLAIYISSNQNDSENTYLNGIEFKGEIDKSGDNQISFQNTLNMNSESHVFEQTNKENSNKLHALTRSLMELKDEITPINSEYLLNANIVCHSYNNCELNECESLQRISGVLKRYNRYHYSKQQKTHNNDEDINIDHIFEDKYKNQDLLNDYHHLLFSHNHQFEEIYSKLVLNGDVGTVCNISKCMMIRRNQRNRASFCGYDSKLSQLYYGDDIVKQQLIDTIHCFYLHTFDVGVRFTNKDKEEISNQEMKHNDCDCDSFDMNVAKIDAYIRRKQRETDSGHSEIPRDLNSKYVLNETYNNKNDYSFGYCYFYWSYYKNSKMLHDDADGIRAPNILRLEVNPGAVCGDFYVEKTFKNFKMEILNNRICVIGENQWNKLVEQTDALMLTIHVKSIYCKLRKTANCFDMKYQQLITGNHLLALLLYCSYTVCNYVMFTLCNIFPFKRVRFYKILQRKFSDTYRKCQNEKIEEMKERHRNYYHFGRYLRECVDCFGLEPSVYDTIDYFKRSNKQLWSKMVYHGVNKHFSFQSMNAIIRGPLSTTTDYMVARNFSGITGMILEFDTKYFWIDPFSFHSNDGNKDFFLRCFDCHWLSPYANESEILFIGGSAPFVFSTIIRLDGQNYEKYLKGIRQMCYFMATSGSYEYKNMPKTNEEKQIVYRLLSHALYTNCPHHAEAHEFKSCPQYIKHLLSYHMKAIKLMCFYNRKEDFKLIDYIFKYDYGWINIELIMTLFPNTDLIEYDASRQGLQFVQQRSIYNSILSYLQKNYRSTKLKQIYIEFEQKYWLDMTAFVMAKYAAMFEKYGWRIVIMPFPVTRMLIQEQNRAKEITTNKKQDGL